MLMLLTILPFIACGNKQADIDKQNKNQTDTIKSVGDKSDTGNVKQTGYTLEPYEVVIKPSDELIKSILGDKLKYRNPEPAEIPAAEKLLKECFDKDKSGTVDHFLNRNLDEYNRQFIGATDDAGDRILYVNCFAKSGKDDDAWKNKLIVSTGGGNNFFNVKINITKSAYYDLKINGTASLSANNTIIDAGNGMDAEFGKDYKSRTPDEKDIAAAEKILQRLLHFLLSIHVSAPHPVLQRFRCQVHHHRFIGHLQHPVRHRLAHRHSGNRAHRRRDAFDVLNVYRRDHINVRI